MLTSVSPALARAMQGVLTPAQSSALLNAAANCAQPLQHRAGVSVQNGNFTGTGWNPADYPELFPQSDQPDVEAPGNGGYRAGDWYSTSYGGPYFDLRTALNQTLNQYIANNHTSGPTFNVDGDSYITNLTTENHTTQNITTQTINGEPAPGTDGAQGPAGPQGGQGPAGAPGAVFYLPGVNPPPNNQLAQLAFDLARNLAARVTALERALRGAKLRFTFDPQRVVTDATFDADACEVKTTTKPLRFRNFRIELAGQ